MTSATADDVDALHSWQSLPEVCEYLPYAPRSREEVAEKAVPPPGIDRWIVRTLGGQPIGEVMTFRVDGHLRLGYAFHPDAWGYGYATEACAAVLAWVWGHHPDDVVMADIDPRNDSSRRVLERLGFVETGRGTDKDGDVVYFSVGRPTAV